MFFQESQQGPLFANPMAATLRISLFSSLHSLSLFEVLLFVATILLKIIVIQINVHSAYRVILRCRLWTPLVKLKTNERML